MRRWCTVGTRLIRRLTPAQARADVAGVARGGQAERAAQEYEEAQTRAALDAAAEAQAAAEAPRRGTAADVEAAAGSEFRMRKSSWPRGKRPERVAARRDAARPAPLGAR